MIFNSTIMILASIARKKYLIQTPIPNTPSATLRLLHDLVQEDNTCFFHSQIRPIDSELFPGYGDVTSGQIIHSKNIFVVNVNWIKGVKNKTAYQDTNKEKNPICFFW